MRSEFLSVYVENAEYEAGAIRTQRDVASLKWRDLLQLLEKYRKIAVGKVLMSGSPKGFYAALREGCNVYQEYLQTNHEELPPTSKVTPIMDAVSCNDFSEAALFGRRSRQQWFQGYEYKDEFLFTQIIIATIARVPDFLLSQKIEQIATLETNKNAFLIDLCKAMVNRDIEGYRSALVKYLEHHFDYYTRLNDKGAITDEDYCLKGSISIDGLGLVRLGNWLGFELEADYRGVPSLLLDYLD